MPSLTIVANRCGARRVAGRVQRFERHDGAGQFHAVVGGLGLAARQFLHRVAIGRMAPQPPGPGLPEQAPSVWMMTVFALMPPGFASRKFARQFEGDILLAQRDVSRRYIVMRAEGIDDFIDQHFRRRCAGGEADASRASSNSVQSRSAARCTSSARGSPALSATSTRRLRIGGVGRADHEQEIDPRRRSTSPLPGGWWWRSRCLP